MKKVIFDVGHPAQVHNFKHIYWDLKKKGWEGIFTAKDKEVTIVLLQKYNLPYKLIGKTKKGLFAKTVGLIKTVWTFSAILLKFKPDIVVCRFSPHACWCSWLFRIPLIGLADTEHTNFLDKLTVPFANAKFSAFTYNKDLGKNHFRFNANIELFYLHPTRFKPSIDHRKILNIDADQEYVIVRFVSWFAHHDIGERGLSADNKSELVDMLSRHYKVFITSETELPEHLKPHQIKISPQFMHEVLSNASLYIGEGASMASEAACLGVPAFYVNTLSVGYVTEEADKGLAIHSTNWDYVRNNLLDFIDKKGFFNNYKEKHKQFIEQKIDPTTYLVWFIENYPGSIKTLKYNSDFQHTFMSDSVLPG